MSDFIQYAFNQRDLARAVDHLFPEGGWEVSGNKLIRKGSTQGAPTESAIQSALTVVVERERKLEIDEAASAHINGTISGSKQIEFLMLAVVALYDDLKGNSRLSPAAQAAIEPLRSVASKVKAVHAERDRVKALPDGKPSDANFPSL